MLVIVASPSFPHTLVMHCLNYELTVLPKIYHCLTRVSVYLAMQITCISHTATRDRNLKKKTEINKYFLSFPTFTLLHQGLLSRVSERVKINVFNSTSYCNYFKSETETKNRLTLWSIRIFRNQPYCEAVPENQLLKLSSKDEKFSLGACHLHCHHLLVYKRQSDRYNTK